MGEDAWLPRRPDEEFRRQGSPLYFTVSDIEGAYRELKQRGVTFDDGEGNTHALMDERR